MIGIIGAMDVEIDQIKSAMTGARKTVISGREFVQGTLCGRDVVAAQCGIGKVNAALCAQAMIMTWRPDLIINVGVGGSLDPQLRFGDMAIADRLVQYDVDTSAIGDPVGFVSTVNKIYFECDAEAVRRINSALDAVEGLRGKAGVIASGDRFVADPALKSDIRERFGAICCEMEGGAIAQVCDVNGVGCAVIRSISDQADGDSTMDYQQFTHLAAQHSTELLMRFLSME